MRPVKKQVVMGIDVKDINIFLSAHTPFLFAEATMEM